jgi:hypothetical protein
MKTTYWEEVNICRKSFKIIGIILILAVVFVGWQASKDPATMFECATIYKTISGIWTGKRVSLSDWGRSCGVRFEYDTFPDIESNRRIRLIRYLEKRIPCREEGIGIALVVTKTGNTYEVHFPLKKEWSDRVLG